jgi:hypothetical protein
MQCFRPFHTAGRAIEGVEAMHLLRKGQAKRLDGRDAVGLVKFVESSWGRSVARLSSMSGRG